MIRGYRENEKLLKISKCLHNYFNPSQNVSISLLNSLVIVSNEGSIACKYFEWGNGGVFTQISHTVSICEIFQISLVMENH